MLTSNESWDVVIVLLSITIAFFGAYTGIIFYEQYRLCSRENKPKLLSHSTLLILMAISLGGVAIWTMHFVGMAAMHLTAPDGTELQIRYRIDLTLVSLAVVVILCYVGLYISASDKIFTEDKSDVIEKFIKDARTLSIQEIRAIKKKETFLFHTLFKKIGKLVVGGVITAAGVCVMHYLGMEAMVLDGKIHWDAGIIAASVIIAIVAATAAFWILFRLLAIFPYYEIFRCASSLIASIAVNGMHYTGMASATFEYIPNRSADVSEDLTVSQDLAVFGALAASVLFMLIAAVVSIADLRVWYYNAARIIRETDIRATLNNNNETLAEQPFLKEYLEIRETDGSYKAIMMARVKFSTSPANSSNAKSSTIYPSVMDTSYGAEDVEMSGGEILTKATLDDM